MLEHTHHQQFVDNELEHDLGHHVNDVADQVSQDKQEGHKKEPNRSNKEKEVHDGHTTSTTDTRTTTKTKTKEETSSEAQPTYEAQEDNDHTSDQDQAEQFEVQIKEIFQPYETQLQEMGITPVEAIKHLLAAHEALERNPEQALTWLTEQYGFQDGSSPTLSKEDIETLAIEKDEQGQSKYPHLNSVSKSMQYFLQSGQAKTAEQAYEQAAWSDTKLRHDMLEGIKSDLAVRLKEEFKDQRAQKASKIHLKTMSEKTVYQDKPHHIRQTMSDIYDEMT